MNKAVKQEDLEKKLFDNLISEKLSGDISQQEEVEVSRRYFIESLVEESLQQIRFRMQLAGLSLDADKIKAYGDSLMNLQLNGEGYKGLFKLSFDKKGYEEERVKAIVQRQREEKLDEINLIYLRGVIVNKLTRFEPQLRLTPAERAKRYVVSLNQRVYQKGYHTETEFDDLVIQNRELVNFLHELDKRGGQYSLFFRWNQIDRTKSGSKGDIIRPLITPLTATEEEIRKLIIPKEYKERKGTDYADRK